MAWQQNLFQNLLTSGILISLGVAVYCRVTKTTLIELIIKVREAFSAPIEE